ncbi:MAG: glycosyltransferase family A protein [Balneolaceae bacterium]|nr:glycosyltransferase family A protein [Balneolaceae bacterium]
MESDAIKNPFISVVLPVYNGEKFIGEAIRSVLAQEYKPIEIIVVNDGSTDQTEKCLEEFKGKLSVIKQQNSGPSSARNRGIEAAKGDYITFIDADDVWAPGNISFHIEQFKSFSELEISVGLTAEMDFESAETLDAETAASNSFLHLVMGASMMKQTVFNDVGLFDEELILRQDTDWFLRARELEKNIAIGKELVLFYRKHQNNRTNDRIKANYYMFKLLKKAKDRKAVRQIFSPQVMHRPENLEELINGWHSVPNEMMREK